MTSDFQVLRQVGQASSDFTKQAYVVKWKEIVILEKWKEIAIKMEGNSNY